MCIRHMSARIKRGQPVYFALRSTYPCNLRRSRHDRVTWCWEKKPETEISTKQFFCQIVNAIKLI